MKKRYILVGVGAIIAALIIYFSVLSIISAFSPEKRLVEDIALDESIKGTSIEESASQVRKEIKAGEKAVPLSRALEEKDSYMCAVKTSYGPISVKLREGMIRQDILWSNTNTTAFIVEGDAYRFSPMYGMWLKFNYSPDMELSEKQMTRGIFSEKELLEKISPANATCIRADIPERDFEFPMEKAFNVDEARKKVNLPI